jgi:AcrR family transcriptional regulator
MFLPAVEGMRMGELCRHSGLDRQLIHYYLKKGYLHPPLYKEGNQAYYGQTHLEKLLFLKENRQKGIPLSYSAKLWKKKTSDGKTAIKRSRRSEEVSPTRELIMEAATRLFLEKGYRSTTISEIMESVGITKPSFYYYFENKKDLYFSCIDNIFQITFAKALEDIRKEQDLMTRLEKRWETTLAFLPEMITFLQLIKDSLREGDEEHRRKAAGILRKAVIDPLVGDLNRGIESGVIRPVDSEISVFAMISVLEIISYRPMIGDKYSDDKIFQAILDTILNGLMV